MKLGFFTMPLHPPGRDYTQTLKEDREAVLLADRLGASFVTGSALGALCFCVGAGVWVIFSLQDAALVGIRHAGFTPGNGSASG